MKVLASLTVKLLLGICLLAKATNAQCNHDNCYRALFPTADPTRLSSALSFCQTYTQGTSTATTGFIPRFTTACSADPAVYSSACSCAPTVGVSTTASPTTLTTSTTSTTSTTTSSAPAQTPTTPSFPICPQIPYEVYQNGDFECGSYPWRGLATDGTTYALTSPGYSGTTAFEVDQEDTPDSIGLGQATLSQLFYLTTNTKYELSFATFWNGGGFVGVKLNGNPVFTVDAYDNKGPNVWNVNTLSFTTVAGQMLLEFEFFLGGSGGYARIDDIILNPGT